MKELSIEEKTKAYDEAIERAKSLLSSNQLGNAWIYKLLPELEESEDERIMKAIKYCIKQGFIGYGKIENVTPDKCLAWLEKQGEKMSDPRYSILNKLIEADDIYQMSINNEMVETAKNKAFDALSKLEISKLLELEKQGERKTPLWMIDFLDNYRRNIGCSLDHDEAKDVDGKILCIKEWLEKQGEQKSTDTCDSSIINGKEFQASEKQDFGYFNETTDNVEPLFHIGDWVVHDMSDGRKVIRQIDNTTKKTYILDGEEGFNTFYFTDLENDYHLWSIKDANVNDILVDKYGNILIYEEPSTNTHYHSYCYCNDKKFVEAKGSHLIEGTHPATKEQHDILFKKMKEAGYEWDVNKKQLERIIDENQIKKNLQDNSFRRMFEENPAWGEEDEERIKNILSVLDVQECWGGGGKLNPYQKEIDWLNYLKNRVEVKDVDLDAEISRYIDQCKSEFKGYDNIRRVARHFFELGIKARKG